MEERHSPPHTFGAERKGAKVEAHQEGRLKELSGRQARERRRGSLFAAPTRRKYERFSAVGPALFAAFLQADSPRTPCCRRNAATSIAQHLHVDSETGLPRPAQPLSQSAPTQAAKDETMLRRS